MKEYYFVYFLNCPKILTREQLSAFITTAVYHNHDIQHFEVTAIDSRLTELQAIKIANKFHLAAEVIDEMEKGLSPREALFEWIK